MDFTRTFIATGGHNVNRASFADGKWSVVSVLTDQNATCLAADPQNPDILYAGTKQAGVWRSEDKGLSWTACGLKERWIKSLAVHPHDANLIYAGTKPALMYVSKDAGMSWTELKGFRRIPNRWWWFSPAEPPDVRPYVIAIALSPTVPDVLLAGIEFGAVVRSDDGGQSWSRHRSGALRDCHTLMFHHSDGRHVYQAGGTGGGAAVSHDAGQNFERKKQGLAKHYGVACAVDPVNPDVWYVNVAASPYKAHGNDPETYLYRTDGSSGWQAIGWAPHPLPGTPAALVTLRDCPGHLYAGLTSGEVWCSKDYGDAWEKMPFQFTQIRGSLLII